MIYGKTAVHHSNHASTIETTLFGMGNAPSTPPNHCGEVEVKQTEFTC